MIPQRNLSLLSNRQARGGGRRIPEAVLERDYCLAWLLVGLSRVPLRKRLAGRQIARFSYRPVPRRVCPTGVRLVEPGANRTFLLASREKALCDTIVASRGLIARSRGAFQTALADDLRIDMHQLATLDGDAVADLASRWPSRRLARLADVITHA